MTSSLPTAQGPQADYAFHTIGWASFQDLCLVVAEVKAKRSVQAFRKVKDKGRDGSFKGLLDIPLTPADTHLTAIQCKHFSKDNTPIKLSHIQSELPKVRKLVQEGLAHGYILMTNATLGNEVAAIEQALKNEGVLFPTIIGKEDLTIEINKDKRIRALVPRLYGLGDLSLILDQKAIAQAEALLKSAREDMRCYVPTEAHRKAVDTLLGYNFVLLLGEPMAGKSVIAINLSLAALDATDCDIIKVNKPQDIETNWSPTETNRLFWVDDAFGSTKLDRDNLDTWNKILPTMEVALKAGNKFILTSRDYIWNGAKNSLKINTFLPLTKGQVEVDVAELTVSEKEHILYNHVKLGGQSKEFKRWLKPHLSEIAKRKTFLPETARRIGNVEFTKNLVTPNDLFRMVDHPKEYLQEILDQLDDAEKAAIAFIFLHGGKVPVGEGDEKVLQKIESYLGVNKPQIFSSLLKLNGSFVVVGTDDNKQEIWTYKHPTIADAYASIIAQNPELTEIYITGAKPESILSEVVCGQVAIPGAAVRVSHKNYPLLINRISEGNEYKIDIFLTNRADDAFLKEYSTTKPEVIRAPSYIYSSRYSHEVKLITRFYKASLVSEEVRQQTVAKLIDNAIKRCDLLFVDEDSFELFKWSDEQALKQRIENELISNLDSIIQDHESEFDIQYDPESHYDDIQESLKIIQENLDINTCSQEITEAKELISVCIENLKTEQDKEFKAIKTMHIDAPSLSSEHDERSIFDDIDED